MALDQNAGKKRAVGIARNLLLGDENPNKTVSEALAPVVEAKAQPIQLSQEVASAQSVPVESGAKRAGEIRFAKPQSGRTRKLSFLTTPELEAKFKKARLRAGFETIEDAYNEAIQRFCEQVDKGEISNF
jgi:hypothetical protein